MLSIPKLSYPLISLKFPPSPQYDPQEFLMIQYLVPFYSPHPVTLDVMIAIFLPVKSLKTPPV